MAIYYIDGDNGNDNNNGTSPETAWRTFSKAFSVLSAGDILYVKPTTYRFSSFVSFSNSGTSGNWIKVIGDIEGNIWGIKDYPRLTTLSASNEYTPQIHRIFDINNRHYIYIEGLRFENGYTNQGSCCIFIYNNSTNISIINCVFYYGITRGSAYESSGLVVAFGTSGTNIVVNKNMFISGIWSVYFLSSGLVLNFEQSSQANAYVYNNLFLGGNRGISTYNQARGDFRNNTFMFCLSPFVYQYAPIVFSNNFSFFSGGSSLFYNNNNYIFPDSTNSKPIFFDFKKIGFFMTNSLDNLSNTTNYVEEDINDIPRPLGSGRDVGCFEYINRGVKESNIVRTGSSSLKFIQAGIEDIKTYLKSGSYTISVYTKWSNYVGSNKPQLLVLKDEYCGISSNQIATATGNGLDWEKLSVNISLSRDAIITIRLYARDTGPSAVTYFDDLDIT